MKLTFHSDADAELTEATHYYESCQNGLGSEFLAEVERALDQISMNPAASRKIGRRVRCKSLWRFPYNLIYAVYPEQLRILALAHQKRRPFYWQKRLKAQSPEV